MDLFEAFKKRHTVRAFKNDEVDSELIKEAIMYSVMAPSATNRQAWHFIIVDDADMRKEVVRLGGSRVILRAKAGVLVLYNEAETSGVFYHDDVQSAAAAIENFLLAATALGLGACWICQLPSPRDLKALFKIPKGYRVVAFLALGYSKQKEKIKEDVDIARFVSTNQCTLSPVPWKVRMIYFIKRKLVWFYYNTPMVLRKRLTSVIEKKYVSKF